MVQVIQYDVIVEYCVDPANLAKSVMSKFEGCVMRKSMSVADNAHAQNLTMHIAILYHHKNQIP